MGGGKPRDQSTMTAASTGAQAADASLARQADQSTTFAKQAHDLLFGTGVGTGGGTAATTGGILSKFIDPNSLNVSEPTGVYGLQYKKDIENIANQGEQNRGALSRMWAQKGFGAAPSGFQADQERQQLADQSNQQGAAFTQRAGQSYADALNNFWNATNIASQQGPANTNAAIAADSAAANNYANLYGTASTPKPPSQMASLLGAGMQGGATVGAAAMTCPCEGSMILMQDGTEKPIQNCKKGDLWQGIDGEPCELLALTETEAPCVLIVAGKYRSNVSDSHTFALSRGGYVYAHAAAGTYVLTGLQTQRDMEEASTIKSVDDIGRRKVFTPELNGSHSYRCDGIWAFS